MKFGEVPAGTFEEKTRSLAHTILAIAGLTWDMIRNTVDNSKDDAIDLGKKFIAIVNLSDSSDR